MMALYMVFDVESVGLHGEGFAVGWVFVNGQEVSPGECRFCDSDHAVASSDESREWVGENVPNLEHYANIPGKRCRSPREVRDKFWEAWEYAKGLGATLAADCLWPVEARFLIACIDDDLPTREWAGPYPFIDIASVRLAAGLDPLGTVDRLPDERPVHDPLADARQSARLLIEALAIARPAAS
jgi:hypothetical protein